MTQLSDLRGLIPIEVGETLQRYATTVPRGYAIVEIGSYQGKSTCYLASGAPHGVNVIAIDPWDLPGNVNGRFGFAEKSTRLAFDRQIMIADLEHKIIPWQGFSLEVAAEWDGTPIGLLYVDGDHSEAAVWGDVMAWLPHVHGVVILDDYGTPKNPGVKRAADRLVDMLGPYAIEAGRLVVWHWT